MNSGSDDFPAAAVVRAIYGVGPRFTSAVLANLARLFRSISEEQRKRITCATTVEELREAAGSHWSTIDYAFSCVKRAGNLVARAEQVGALPKRGRTLDVGCAYAGVLVCLARRGFDVYGIELSPLFAELGDQNIADEGLTGRVIAGDLYAHIRKMGTFDLITCNDVIEHVPDPGRALRLMASALKPGGSLVVYAPNGRSIFNVSADPHYQLFGTSILPRSLAIPYVQKGLQSAGYGMGEYHRLEWYLNVLNNAGLETTFDAKDLGERFDRLQGYLADAFSAFKQADEKIKLLDPVIQEEFLGHAYTYFHDLMKAAADAYVSAQVREFVQEYLTKAWTVVGRAPEK